MGNVLIRYNAYDYVKKYVSNEEAAKLLLEEVFQSVEWIQLDRGVLREEDAIASMRARIPAELHPYVQILFDNWHEDIPPYEDMEKMIAELKENGYGIYLLSNTSQRFHKFRVNIPALKYFDGEFISSDYRMVKPELEIFRTFYQHFLLNPAECFFIDDYYPNVEAAVATGMKGFIYRGDVEKCKAAMRKEGITI